MASITICHGCLSIDRQLFTVEEHAKLYRQLLLKKSNINVKKLMMCWECCKILNNIHTFRMKITQAQRLLNKKSLTKYSNLSNLGVTKKIDDYQIITYEDEKVNITPIEIEEPTIIKEETDNELGIQIISFQSLIKEELKDETDDLDDTDDKVKTDEFDNDKDKIEDFDDADYKVKTDDFDDDKDKIDDFHDADDKYKTDDFDDPDDKDDITELDEVLVPIDLLQKKTEIKMEQGRNKRGVLKKKYRTIIMDDIPDKRNFYDVIKIDADTIKRDMEKKKKKSSNKKFQCQRCYSGFLQQKLYERHLAVLHSQFINSSKWSQTGTPNYPYRPYFQEELIHDI